jgi:hypothetical protein
MVGPGPHAVADAARHPARLNAVIVGETSRARKGTSHDNILPLVRIADATFINERTLTGLSSGEGLIAAIRDTDDQRAVDKRALVTEPEFARVLTVAKRDGSTLSMVIREAWDHGNLRVMTRANPLSATGSHVGIIAHITADELRTKLTDTDVANGFANRFLYICAKRSKLLPEGRGVPPEDIQRLGRLLRTTVKEARTIDLLTRRSRQARDRWNAFYLESAESVSSGMLGALTARAEAQCLRLSVAYALLDRSDRITSRHVDAAIAVWRYSEDSCTYLFGTNTGDSVVDRLLAELRRVYPKPLTGQDQRDLFSHHVSTERLAAARLELESNDLAYSETIRTNGRSQLRTYAGAESAVSAESQVAETCDA